VDNEGGKGREGVRLSLRTHPSALLALFAHFWLGSIVGDGAVGKVSFLTSPWAWKGVGKEQREEGTPKLIISSLPPLLFLFALLPI